ncbi:hypothetical protein Q9L58_008691 [Maublancomyces gigas]|uniref:Uncharacterized protein n=1 Tax=Discina gigas TaxID=1032678 RepID=A0ABR3G9D6_9PEZI
MKLRTREVQRDTTPRRLSGKSSAGRDRYNSNSTEGDRSDRDTEMTRFTNTTNTTNTQLHKIVSIVGRMERDYQTECIEKQLRATRRMNTTILLFWEISDPGFVFAASVTDQDVLDNLFVGDATQRSFVVHFLRRFIWATRALEATRDQLTAAANTIAETQVITETITNAFTASSLPLAWAAIKVQIVWLKNLQNASGNDKASLRDLTKWSTIASEFRTELSEIMFPGQCKTSDELRQEFHNTKAAAAYGDLSDIYDVLSLPHDTTREQLITKLTELTLSRQEHEHTCPVFSLSPSQKDLPRFSGVLDEYAGWAFQVDLLFSWTSLLASPSPELAITSMLAKIGETYFDAKAVDTARAELDKRTPMGCFYCKI